MPNMKAGSVLVLFAVLTVGAVLVAGAWHVDEAMAGGGKVKVLYHVDGKDLATAKYAMALINKHIEAEGGPDRIDVKLIVHGPALPLFDAETVDPGLKAGLKKIIAQGVDAEMCQVSMKLFGKPLDKLVAGFQPTAHPVAVKRIADLQREGYIYIKP